MKLVAVLAYLKLRLQVGFFRSLQSLRITVERLTGSTPTSSIKPFNTIYVNSSKSNRRIRVDVYRNQAALKKDAGPVAVHLNWHGKPFSVHCGIANFLQALDSSSIGLGWTGHS